MFSEFGVILAAYKKALNPDWSGFESDLLDIRQVFQRCDNSIHKARNEIKLLECADAVLVIKSFKVPGLLRSVIYSFFRQSKARRSYDYSLLLADFAPKPVGYIEFYQNGLLRDSYYVSENFDYDFTIRQPLSEKGFEGRENVFAAFAKFTCQLHENNICHQDYSPGNILVRQCGDDYEFKIVDVNRMRFMHMSVEQRAANLCRLGDSAKDIELIAGFYAQAIGTDKDAFTRLALQHFHKHKSERARKRRLKNLLGLG